MSVNRVRRYFSEDEVRAHLNLTDDESTKHAFFLLDGAASAFRGECGCSIEEVAAAQPTGQLPDGVRCWLLLYMTEMFAHRGLTVAGRAVHLEHTKSLISRFIDNPRGW